MNDEIEKAVGNIPTEENVFSPDFVVPNFQGIRNFRPLLFSTFIPPQKKKKNLLNFEPRGI